MNPQDLKKLIAGFLVFSAVASTVTLISFNFIGKTNPQQQAFQADGSTNLPQGGEDPLSTVSKNAFVEKLPSGGQQASVSGNTQSAYVANTDSSNLTQNMAGIFAGQMIDNNPSGPQTDQNGDPTVINLPGEDKTAEMIRQALSKTAFAFDDKTSVPAGKISKSFTPGDVSGYLKQVNEVLNQVSSSTKLSMAANQSSTPESLVLPALAIEAASEKLSSLSVPKPFVETHTAILRFFANQKNVLNAVADYQADPMKTMLALQNENEIVSRDIALIKNAALKIDQKTFSSNTSSEWQKLYSGIFGIQKVYAGGMPVIDFVNWTVNWAELGKLIESSIADITKWAYGTALRIAVNVLINEFQNQVVNWIAGNGKPKFITDWSGFFTDVADKAAGQAIAESKLSGLCSGLGPIIRANLLPVPYATNNIRCTLTGIVRNANNFFNRFRNGTWYETWSNYGALMRTNNNYFGNLIEAHDRQLMDIAKAVGAADSQAKASKGFLDQTECVQYSTKVEDCTKWDESGNECQAYKCIKEVTRTPGDIVGQNLRTSLGWKGNQIVSAQRFEDLVSAIVNASINRIMKEGLSALSKEMTDKLDNKTPPNASASSLAFTYRAGNPASLSGTIRSVNDMISSFDQVGVFQDNQTIITSDTEWLTLVLASTTQSQATTSALTALNQLSNSCPSMSGQISERIGDLNSLASTIRTELNNANDIKNVRSRALSATSTENISAIVSQLQAIDLTAIKTVATTAQQRLASIIYFISVVQNISSEGGCGGALPAIDAIPPPPASG